MERGIIQKVVRVYGPGYTGSTFDSLQEDLKDGWIVAHITCVKDDKHDKDSGKVHDYILQKYIQHQ